MKCYKIIFIYLNDILDDILEIYFKMYFIPVMAKLIFQHLYFSLQCHMILKKWF